MDYVPTNGDARYDVSGDIAVLKKFSPLETRFLQENGFLKGKNFSGGIMREAMQRSGLDKILIGVAVIVILSVSWPRPLSASGPGTGGSKIRVSDERIGPYVLLVATSPLPVTVGQMSVWVRVTDAQTDQLRPDARVTITATPPGNGPPITAPATHQNAGNNYDYVAHLEVNQTGPWNIAVYVDDEPGQVQTAFTETVSQGRNVFMLVAVAVPFVVLTLAVGIFLWRRSASSSPDVPSDRRTNTPILFIVNLLPVPILEPLLHFGNLCRLSGDNRIGQQLDFFMLGLLLRIRGHADGPFVVGYHGFDKALVKRFGGIIAYFHCPHRHAHSTGLGQVGIPGLAPRFHLVNFGRLAFDNILRQRFDFSFGSFFEGLIGHINGPLVVNDHTVNEQRIVRQITL